MASNDNDNHNNGKDSNNNNNHNNNSIKDNDIDDNADNNDKDNKDDNSNGDKEAVTMMTAITVKVTRTKMVTTMANDYYNIRYPDSANRNHQISTLMVTEVVSTA